MTARVPLLALVALTALLAGAGHDDNIEWAGITHIDWLDRAPRCPIDGESFSVFFQTYHFDITSARVWIDNGAPFAVDAGFLYERGIYDVWQAIIPATSPTGYIEYYFELTDGTDTDYLGPSGMSAAPPASGWWLNFASTAHAPLGCTLLTDGGAAFKVWAPGAATANLAGTFNGWSPSADAMTPDGDFFRIRMDPNIPPGSQYKYVFNGNHWRPDARGRAWNPSNKNNTFVIDPEAYLWSDQLFGTPPFEEMVIYELHVGTFSGRNDGLNRMGRFRDIVDTHLDHLLYLGVNCVELMPITEFDYYESWGYNPVHHWGPENAYGNPDDLKYLIDRLHRAGIAVVLDIVYNHFSDSGNELWDYDTDHCYFEVDQYGDPVCRTPWGSQAEFPEPGVFAYFADNIFYWLEEYHVDGFRMDATRYMRDPLTCYPAGWYLMQEINNRIDARKADAISIAEELPNDTAVTTSTGSGGAGFDSQWHDAFTDNVRQEIFDAAFGDPEMWKVKDAINDFAYPNKTNLIRYVEGHDEAGNEDRFAVQIDGSDPYSMWAKGRSKLAQGLALLSPGIPMFLMGGEWLEDIKFGSGWNNRIDWAKAVGRPEMVLFFRDAIGVKKSNCALRSDSYHNFHHLDETNNIIGFYRSWGNVNDLVVVASFKNSDVNFHRVGFPKSGTWYEILNSQALEYLGNGSGNGGAITTQAVSWDGMPYSAEITVPQMGLLVFRYEDPPGKTADLDFDGDVDLHDAALLQQETGYQSCTLEYDIRENGRVDAGDLDAMSQAFTGPN